MDTSGQVSKVEYQTVLQMRTGDGSELKSEGTQCGFDLHVHKKFNKVSQEHQGWMGPLGLCLSIVTIKATFMDDLGYGCNNTKLSPQSGVPSRNHLFKVFY